jgi:hypothetical protein
MAMLANAQAAKRWLAAEPPNRMEAIASIDRIARDARAADEMMKRVRSRLQANARSVGGSTEHRTR